MKFLCVLVIAATLSGLAINADRSSHAQETPEISIHIQDSSGNPISGGCFTLEPLESRQRDISGVYSVCDNDDWDGDITSEAGLIIVPTVLAVKVIVTRIPDGFALAAGQPVERISPGGQSFDTTYVLDDEVSQHDAAEINTQDVETRIAVLEQGVRDLSATIQFMSQYPVLQLPTPLDPTTEMTAFGGAVFPTNGIPAEKTFTLYCVPFEGGRSTEVLLQCGWMPYKYP